MTELLSEKSLTILVVDDDQLLNQLLCEFLSSKGLDTVSAYGLAEAGQTLKKADEIDLVLLDYDLGDGTGLDLMRSLTKDSTHSVPPVIMISVNEDPEFLENCFSCGIADYIIKPVNLSLLALKVRALINSVAMQKLISLQNAELAHFKREAEREEAVAKFIYEYLLGQNSQRVEGVETWLQSSSSFSGDIAMARTSPSGDLYFMLADATGHGLSAAITIMPAVSIFNSMVAKGFHLQPIVTELNKKLSRDTPPDRFVAALIIHVQQGTGELHIWNGGMPTAYWVSAGKILQSFRSRHMALGILDDHQFDSTVETFRYTKTGFLFGYTDGLLEEANSMGDSFSMRRVVEVIESDPDNLHDELISALKLHTGMGHFKDDISMCTLTPSRMLIGSSILLSGQGMRGKIAEGFGRFSWGLELSGRQIADCEIPPLVNEFLQYLGLEKNICQIVFLIVTEMISNAIDHGILRLESGLKEKEDGFDLYFQERESRLHKLTAKDVICLAIEWNPEAPNPDLTISVRDTGDGYDPGKLDKRSDEKLSGRGLHLIRGLAQAVEIIPPGNRICAVIRSIQ
uniref:SpoIIE family protein phosphatase n=1 Tax=Cellvibrio fontiphilus TaxID=1815559 RepID=UPI002B4C0973|nr:SpoIIE family protein phosphatase [Cellvibrio fontiphilus]